MSQFLWRTAAIALTIACGVWPVPIRAQAVARLVGSVSDSATGAPLVGVAVTITATSGGAATRLSTDTRGVFSFGTPQGGVFAVTLQKLGYRPIRNGAVTVAVGAPAALAIRMSVVAQPLDTVLSEAPAESFGLTPGRELFRRHVLEGKGQFVSGLEIQRSHLQTSEYLASLPGIRMVDNVPLATHFENRTFKHPVPTLPGIPAADFRVLISASETRCLYGRIDRFFVPDLLLAHGVSNIDELLHVEDITGVEVYIVQRDMPPEWRAWAFLDHWLAFGPPINALMGKPTAGFGAVPGFDDLKFQVDDLSDLPIGPCGFIQIWTKVAW